MATTNSPRNQIPLKYDIVGKDGKVTQPWAFFLQTFQENLPPSNGGAGYVIDGTKGTLGSTIIDQGPASDKGTAVSNAIYVAPDTGAIYTVNSGTWQLQTPALTGDVTKPAFSSITTLSNVGTAGIWGTSTSIPQFTTDEKGRVVNVNEIEIDFRPNVSGKIGAVLYKSDYLNDVQGAGNLLYDAISGNIIVTSSILFDDPVPTFANLSPLANVGDILTHTTTSNAVLPIGANGYVLTANTSSNVGISWEPSGGTSSPAFVEIAFNYGDATPKLLTTVPNGKMVLFSSIVIKESLNGVGANLTIGSTSVPDDVMGVNDCAPSIPGTWATNPNTYYSLDTPIYLTINSGSGASIGSGLVVLQIQN